jgi:hypothetical protein
VCQWIVFSYFISSSVPQNMKNFDINIIKTSGMNMWRIESQEVSHRNSNIIYLLLKSIKMFTFYEIRTIL